MKRFTAISKGATLAPKTTNIVRRSGDAWKWRLFEIFLVWYNDLDVRPFVTAVESFRQFYFDKGIDVFKTAISVPGIARQLLFQSAKKHRSVQHHQTKHLIVGGPSIIFTRHHASGKTRIRGQKSCGSNSRIWRECSILTSYRERHAGEPFYSSTRRERFSTGVAR